MNRFEKQKRKFDEKKKLLNQGSQRAVGISLEGRKMALWCKNYHFPCVYMKWPFPLSEMCCQWRGFTSRKDSLLDFSPSYKQVCYRPHKLTSRDTSMAKWTCEEITSNSFVFTSLLYFCVVVNRDSVYSSLTVFVNYLIVSGCLSTVFNLSVES